VQGRSSPDNDEMGRHHQTTQARQTRREGVTRSEPVVEPPQAMRTGSNLVDVGRAAVHVRPGAFWERRLAILEIRDSRGPWEKPATRTHGRTAGEQLGTAPVNRLCSERGNRSGAALPPASQVGEGQVRCRLTAPVRDGASVVVRGRESRLHGKGRQRDRGVGTGRPGGRR
jgi:hypothetical protein